MKQLIKTYGWQSLIELSALFIIGILQVIVLFFPHLGGYIQFEIVFRLIVLLVLGDIMFRLISLSPQKLRGIEGVVGDKKAKSAILQAARRYNSRRATILSSGLSSRTELLLDLAEAGLEIEVLYQDPEHAPDSIDGGRIQDRIALITERINDIPNVRNCNFSPFKQPATIRCILLYDSNDRPCFAQVGWYTYAIREDNTRVRVFGTQHPSLLVSKEGPDGIRLLNFLAKMEW